MVVGAFALAWLLFYIVQSWPELIPFADPVPVYIALIALPVLAMFGAALANKLIEGRTAAKWAETMGRVTRSNVDVSPQARSGDPDSVKTIPAIDYTFTVDGASYTGNRIAIGEDSGGPNLKATLQRYPLGAIVKVYYDPADPTNSLLERDVPAPILMGCAALLAGAIAVTAAIYAAIRWGAGALQPHVPQGRVALVIVALCFAVVLLGMFLAARKMTMAAARWPMVKGHILRSEVTSHTETRNGRTTTYYAPSIEYAYTLDGLEFHGARIALNLKTAGSPSYAEKLAARYPLDSLVDVRYDPADPTSAILENPAGTQWFLLAGSLIAFAVAAWAADPIRF